MDRIFKATEGENRVGVAFGLAGISAGEARGHADNANGVVGDLTTSETDYTGS